MDKISVRISTQLLTYGRNHRMYVKTILPTVRFPRLSRIKHNAQNIKLPNETDVSSRYIRAIINKSDPKISHPFEIIVNLTRLACVVMAVIVHSNDLDLIPLEDAYARSMSLTGFCFYTIEQIPNFMARACEISDVYYVNQLNKEAEEYGNQ